MRKIYRYAVMEELVKGNEVYAIVFTRTKPMIENAATIAGRVLARYLDDDDVDWYASDEEVEDGESV